ncbi:MAG: hypothetical protein KJ941_11585 [Bacteroidetes bacterium]|nr:hypothetical protein [Bacteroidota bacterium]
MAEEKKTKETEAGLLKVLEFITELIGWLQIVSSPLMIGLAIGSIVYFSNPSMTRLVIGIIISTIGLILGIIWATKVWRRKGTVFFLSRTMATPDLDNIVVEDDKRKTQLNNAKKGNR